MSAVKPNFEPNIRADCTEELTAALRKRIVVIDGAMGTAISAIARTKPATAASASGLAERPGRQQRSADPDPAAHHRAGIHRWYLEAGADILETNTFNANAVSLSDYGMEELSYEAQLRQRRPGAGRLMTSSARPERLRYVAGRWGR